MFVYLSGTPVSLQFKRKDNRKFIFGVHAARLELYILLFKE